MTAEQWKAFNPSLIFGDNWRMGSISDNHEYHYLDMFEGPEIRIAKEKQLYDDNTEAYKEGPHMPAS